MADLQMQFDLYFFFATVICAGVDQLPLKIPFFIGDKLMNPSPGRGL